MAKMWFYTEPQFLKNQSAPTTSNVNDSFGPWLNNSGYNSKGFNLTNFFKRDIDGSPLDYQPKAFAVTGGTVAVIKQIRNDDPLLDPDNYVNIVLYPDSQPGNLPDIKCFIYRNIEISSIADTSDTPENPKIYSDTSFRSTDLGKKIIKAYKDFGEVGNYPTIADAGQQLHAQLNPLEDNIEDYFLKNFDPGSVSNMNLPRVEGGDWIGNFNSEGSSAGFEIMFDNINFHPITAIVSGYPGSDDIDGGRNVIKFSNSSAFEIPHYQETLPNYLDPAAFYGSLIDVGVKFKVIQNEVPQNEDPYTAPLFSEVEKSGNSLYNDVLAKFYNKNKVYIDIRDRWNMSYMFENFPFTTASDDLRLSFHDEGVVSPNPAPYTSRYRDKINWPLLVLSNADFGNGVGYELDNKKIIGLQFPSFDPSSESVAFFVDNKKMLLKSDPPLEDSGRDNSVLINLANDGLWTTRFLLGVPFVNDGTNNVLVANYIKIRYIKHQHEYTADYDDFVDPNAGIVGGSSVNLELDTDTKDYLDPVFPVNLNLKWKNSPTGNLKSTVYYEGLYLDNTKEGGRDFFANVGIAHDAQDNITFFAYSTKTPSRSTKGLIDTTFSLTSKSKKYDKSFLRSLVEVEKFGAKMIFRSLTYNNVIPSISVRDLRPADEKEVIIDNGRASHLADFISFEMTYSQYENLKQLTNTTGANFIRLGSSADPRFKNNPRMFFHPVLVDRILETGKPPLLKYNWTIVGFSDENSMSLTRVYSNIFTYRIEGKNRNIENREDQPYTEGVGFSLSEQPTSTYHIKSTIYLIRGKNVTVQELKAYRAYALNNIQSVWNTISNRGFTTPLRLDFNDPVPVPQETIFADQVEIKIAGAEQWKRLRLGEALWLVEKDQNRSRILGTTNMNIGIIDFKNTSGNPSVYTESSINTPAHEFGHMLGLTDRYAYYTVLESATSVQINKEIGTSIPIYVNDPDYKDEYRWKNNLYSTQRIVNAGDFGGLANYSNWMTGYHTQTIFITPQQWNIIKTVALNGMSSKETIVGSQYVFIFQEVVDYAGLNFTGMVSGLPESDANFSNSANPDRMDERINDVNGSNPPAGWVYPVIINIIKSNDRYEVLKPRLGLALDDDTPDVGLNAFIFPAWLTQAAFIPGSSITLTPLLGTKDQHRAPGSSSVIGDAFGFNIWNQLNPKESGSTKVNVYSSAAFQRFSHDIIYNQQYYNRILIMRLVVDGELPTQFDK